jgi:isoleucyl-tRNA synthetase
LPEVRAALAEGRFTELDGGRFHVNGYVLEPDDVLVERIAREGWVVQTEGRITVGIDTTLSEELLLEARVADLIRAVQVLRKESGLEVTDRIRLWIPDGNLLAFSERIAAETLAVSVELGPELRLEKA